MEQVTTKLHDRRLYVGDYLISPDQRIENGAVLCEDEQILAVGGFSGFSMEEGVEVIKYPNSYIVPGFIDTHIHGAGGCDCSSIVDSINGLEAMSAILGQRGVTGFFPTVVSQ